jgi:hypothetical protein
MSRGVKMDNPGLEDAQCVGAGSRPSNLEASMAWLLQHRNAHGNRGTHQSRWLGYPIQAFVSLSFVRRRSSGRCRAKEPRDHGICDAVSMIDTKRSGGQTNAPFPVTWICSLCMIYSVKRTVYYMVMRT